MNVILLGPPGAGKGTQANRLERALGLPHIASGDIFRSILRENSPLSEQVRHYMDLGQYVPDDLTVELVLHRLEGADARNGFLLDGYPRTLVQADALDDALASRGQKVDFALFITAPTDVLVSRIVGRVVCPNCNAIYNLTSNPPRVPNVCDVCGYRLERRADEEPEVVRTRLEAYVRQTTPLVDYYRNHGTLLQVDGSRPIAEVEAVLDGALGVVNPR